MKIAIVLAVIVGLALADEKYYTTVNKNFDIDALMANPEEFQQLVGCFLEKNDCDEAEAIYKKSIPEVFENACAKCNDTLKVTLKKFFAGLKEKLPEDYEAFLKMYDPESKYYPALEKAINA